MAGNFDFNINGNADGAINAANQFSSAFGNAVNSVEADLDRLAKKQRQIKLEIEAQGLERAARQLERARNELGRMAQKSADVKSKQEALNGVFSKNSNTLSKQVQYLNQYKQRLQQMKQPSENIKRTLGGLESNIKKGNAALATMRTGVRGVSGETRSMASQFTAAGVAANLITGAISNAANALAQFVKTGLQMELLLLQLEGFTGGAEQARETFKEFKDIAVKTPLNVAQVAQAGKIMLAFGLDTKVATENLRRLAVIAGATGSDVQLLARNLGQVSANNRAFSRDLMQFANAGIPIYQELSKVTGLYGEDLQKAVEAGKIGFPQVEQALRNLTAAGGDFDKIAKEMNNTFTGVIEELVTEIQDFAGVFVTSLNEVDESMGNVIKGSFRLVSEALRGITENTEAFKDVLAPLTWGLGALATGMLFVLGVTGKLALGWTALTASVMQFGVAQALAVAAQAAWTVLSNPAGFAIVALAVTAGAIAWNDYKNKVNEATNATQKAQSAARELSDGSTVSWGDVQKAIGDANLSLDDYITGLEGAVAAQDKELTKLNKQMGKQIEVLKTLGKARDDEYKKQETRHKDRIKQLETEIKTEEANLKRAEKAVNDKYDAEELRINTIFDKKMADLDAEIGRLREKTPAERALYDLQKKQLEADIASGKLRGEDLLRAQARLERMQQQEKIDQLMVERAEARAEKEKQIADVEKQRQGALQNIADQYQTIIDKLETEKKTEQELLNQVVKNRKAANKEIQDAINLLTNKMKPAQDDIDIAIKNQITSMQGLGAQIDINTGKAEMLRKALEAARRESERAQSASGGGQQQRFAGGPVSGGTTYTVNELGKEAFLSASGKLSMINAPAFGDWKAPGAGTVIPAHITSGMSIPSGGVNVSKNASNRAHAAASSGSSIMRALRGLTGGSSDRITNNVTIQAANTTQAASDMLVNLTKLRRQRR